MYPLRSTLAAVYNHRDRMRFGKDGYPIIKKCNFEPKTLLAFNACLTSRKHKNTVHFFIEDYRFERAWEQLVRYGSVLLKYDGAFSPDFSVYMDMPRPAQIWNVFRNRLCGAYWQSLGIEVVPTVGWGKPDTYDFCFAGLQKGTNVAVSTIGILNGGTERAEFARGFEAMVEAVKPRKILIYGREFPGDLPGRIRYYPYSFENNHRKKYKSKGGNNGR